MFHKILVPLDGSELSESAIPAALEVARRFGASLVLFRAAVLPEHLMISPVPLAPSAYTHLQDEIVTGTREYLDAAKARLAGEGVPVETGLVSGDAATQILEFAETQGVDLIVMCTHGRSGFQRWLFGSVAEKVMRHSACPVLSVRPK